MNKANLQKVKARVLVFFSRVKKTTLFYLGVLIAGSAVSQMAWVQHHIVPYAAGHPHLAPVVTLITLGIGILHSPLLPQVVEVFEQSTEEQKTDGSTKTVDTMLTTSKPAPPAA